MSALLRWFRQACGCDCAQDDSMDRKPRGPRRHPSAGYTHHPKCNNNGSSSGLSSGSDCNPNSPASAAAAGAAAVPLKSMRSPSAESAASHASSDSYSNNNSNSSSAYPGSHYSRSLSGGGLAGAGRVSRSSSTAQLHQAAAVVGNGRSISRPSSSSGSATAAAASASAAALLGDDPFALAHLFDKLCAGVLLYSGGEVLLLQRNSRYNDLCWDFPGGQVDPEDISVDEQYRRHFHSNLQQRQQQRHQQLQSQQANSTASTASDSTTTAAAPTATATATANALLSQSSQVPLYDRGTPPSLHHGFGLGSGTWAAAIREAAEELGCLPTPLQLITAHNVYRGDGCKRYTVYVCKVAEATKTALRPPLSEEHAAYGWFPVAALFPLVAATGGRFEVHPWIYAFAEQHPAAWAQLAAPQRWVPTPHAPADAARALKAQVWAVMRAAGAPAVAEAERKEERRKRVGTPVSSQGHASVSSGSGHGGVSASGGSKGGAKGKAGTGK